MIYNIAHMAVNLEDSNDIIQDLDAECSRVYDNLHTNSMIFCAAFHGGRIKTRL